MGGSRLASSTLLVLLADGFPMAVGLAVLPVLSHAAGDQRLGVLMLAWTLVVYLGQLDLGLSRAITQMIAQRLGRNDLESTAAIAWTGVSVLTAVGVATGLALTAAAEVLARRVLSVPPELTAETANALRLLGASVPLLLVFSGLRGVLEAHHRFGLAAGLRLPMMTLVFAGPVLVLPWTQRLEALVGIVVLARLLGVAASLVACLRISPGAAGRRWLDPALLPPMLRYGGWATVSATISPIMVSLDRFLVGAVVSLTAVAHYTTPFQAAVGLLIVPSSVVSVLFPMLSAGLGRAEGEAARVFDHALRLILAGMLPITLVLMAAARPALGLWMGPTWTGEPAAVLQLLTAGVLINALAFPGLALIHAAGRPDLSAKVHLAELPAYLVTVLLLTREWGITGTAIAWLLRVTVDAAAMLWLARRLAPDTGPAVRRAALAAGAVLPAAAGLAWMPESPAKWALLAAALGGLALAAWRWLLSESERERLRRGLGMGGRTASRG